MTQAHPELRAGELRLALRPDLGGSIAGLWCCTLPVLRSTCLGDGALLAAAEVAAAMSALAALGDPRKRRSRKPMVRRETAHTSQHAM